MSSCAVWTGLSQRDKEKRVKCIKHPFKSDHLTQNCTVSGRRCRNCSLDTHHFLLCPKKPAKSKSNVAKISTIDLLISMRHNYLHPQAHSTIGGVTLYKGRFGMVDFDFKIFIE